MLRWVHKLQGKLKILSEEPVVKVNDEAQEIAKEMTNRLVEDTLDVIFKGKVNCNICQKQLGNIGELNKHMITSHKNMTCAYCNFSTNIKASFSKHINQLKCTSNKTSTGKLEGKCSGKQLLINNFFNKPKWKPTKIERANGKKLKDEMKTYLPPIGKDLIPQMLTFYVDDGIIFGKALPKGIRYNPTTNYLEMSTAQLKIDENLPPDIRMANIILSIGNSIDPDIQLTADSPSMNPNNYMPVLDTQMTLMKSEDFPAGEIIFRHYRKPMASKLTIQKESAPPYNKKSPSLHKKSLGYLETPTQSLDYIGNKTWGTSCKG